jgi:hypothetical protein
MGARVDGADEHVALGHHLRAQAVAPAAVQLDPLWFIVIIHRVGVACVDTPRHLPAHLIPAWTKLLHQHTKMTAVPSAQHRLALSSVTQSSMIEQDVHMPRVLAGSRRGRCPRSPGVAMATTCHAKLG